MSRAIRSHIDPCAELLEASSERTTEWNELGRSVCKMGNRRNGMPISCSAGLIGSNEKRKVGVLRERNRRVTDDSARASTLYFPKEIWERQAFVAKTKVFEIKPARHVYCYIISEVKVSKDVTETYNANFSFFFQVLISDNGN